MARRDLLHHKHLEAFKNWLVEEGWTIEQSKGEYEVLRATKPKRKRPLIVFTKLYAKEHYSVMEQDIGVVINFLKSR